MSGFDPVALEMIEADAFGAGATVVVTATGGSWTAAPGARSASILRVGFEPADARPNDVSVPGTRTSAGTSA